MKKPDIKAFAEKTIHQSCDAFVRGDSLEDKFSFPFYGELSCKKKYPKLISYEDGHIQGRFNFVGGSIGDLYLLCSHYAEIGEEYYTFFSADWDNHDERCEWVIWTPNTKHFNDRKKEEV